MTNAYTKENRLNLHATHSTTIKNLAFVLIVLSNSVLKFHFILIFSVTAIPLTSNVFIILFKNQKHIINDTSFHVQISFLKYCINELLHTSSRIQRLDRNLLNKALFTFITIFVRLLSIRTCVSMVLIRSWFFQASTDAFLPMEISQTTLFKCQSYQWHIWVILKSVKMKLLVF